VGIEVLPPKPSVPHPCLWEMRQT